MNININWQAVALLVTLALAWTGFLFGLIRWLLVREIKNIEERLAAATAGIQKHRDECLLFRATLPVDYNRREDMIRFETVTHAKLDGLASYIRQLECQKCQTKAQ